MSAINDFLPSRVLAFIAFFLTVGCAKENDVVLESRVFPPGKLDFATSDEQPACFVFRTDERKLYVGTFASRPTLDIPEWCLNPTEEAIKQHFRGEKMYSILEATSPDRTKKDKGDDPASRGGLRVPFDNAEDIFGQLSKRIIIVADTGKARFAILPGHRYRLSGKKRSTATARSSDRDVNVIYFDIHAVEYLGDPDEAKHGK